MSCSKVYLRRGWVVLVCCCFFFFFFQAEDGIRDYKVTGVQTCALPISSLVKTDPHPVMPSSVKTATSVCTQSCGFSSLLHPPSGVPPRNPAACIFVIFMTALDRAMGNRLTGGSSAICHSSSPTP